MRKKSLPPLGKKLVSCSLVRVLLNDGVLLTDGQVIGDGVIAGDAAGVNAGDTLFCGDNTTSMEVTPDSGS
jgi:hypothetical protein